MALQKSNPRTGRFEVGILSAGIFLLSSTIALAQNSVSENQDVEVIQTQLGPDQVVEKNVPEPASAADTESAESQVSTTSDQIMKINKSLKNSIQENKKLLEE